jgi:activator of HSP90 ATPase
VLQILIHKRRVASVMFAVVFTVAALDAAVASIQAGQEISRNAESIHQEIVFTAGRDRVYTALTNPQQFTKVVELGPLKNVGPAEIGPRAGDTFSLFGGHIVGRSIELTPSQRIVQAWRTVDWPAGVYSVARFELRSQGAQTLVVFDHTGFPAGESASLLDGWNSHYWEPLKKFLSIGPGERRENR